MTWTELAHAVLPGGDVLTLRRDGADFEIRFNLYELMSSRASVSERALAEVACARIEPMAAQVLIGGLGMGYTLRAVLDVVGPEARVTVAELVPAIVEWNRGPLADLGGRPLEDARVSVHTGDVREVMSANPRRFDVILMDVDNGPEAVLFASNHVLYSAEGVKLMVSALAVGGVLSLWAADRSLGFERALEATRVTSERVEVDVHGLVHTIYLVRAE